MWFRCRLALTLALALVVCNAVAAQVVPNNELQVGAGDHLVRAHCLVCHSAQLIVQSSLTRTQWLDTIRYMQRKHNLWPLGDQESVILDYLEANYGARYQSSGRRKNLPYYR